MLMKPKRRAMEKFACTADEWERLKAGLSQRSPRDPSAGNRLDILIEAEKP